MNIAIVGSRTFNDYEYLKTSINNTLNALLFCDIDNIISGGAKGADTLAEKYADEYNINKIIYKPDWDKYGKRAGFIRNEDIIKACDICFAFWDGKSHGTKHDINLCKKYNKECYIFKYE